LVGDRDSARLHHIEGVRGITFGEQHVAAAQPALEGGVGDRLEGDIVEIGEQEGLTEQGGVSHGDWPC